MLSLGFFLLLVPGINETLTPLPPAKPLAESVESPAVKGALPVWLLVFLLGDSLQVPKLRSQGRKAR